MSPEEVQPVAPARHPHLKKWLRRIAKLFAVLVLALAITWATAAIWYDGPTSRLLAGLLSTVLVMATASALWFLKPFRRALATGVALFVIVLAWWRHIPASNDRDWQPDVARLPRAEFKGNHVTIQNVRDFEYRSNTDFTPRWETREYDLDKVVGVDLFISYWGPTLYAHTIASWEFSDGKHLAISIETRKTMGEQYSAVRGLFRQYELYYVVADELDLIGVRACYRGENLYLYRIRTLPGMPEKALREYLVSLNDLAEHPKWYNAITENCTTTIRYNMEQITPVQHWNWKILANGYLDELLYKRGRINTSMPFEELKRQSDITALAKAACDKPDFSQDIRKGLPALEPFEPAK